MEVFSAFKRDKLPEIIQSEASECGLACITMIAAFHGHDIDLRSMRAKFPVSLKGMTVDAIIGVAEKLNLGARALKLDLDKIDKLVLPAILHWDLNHFVVLKSIDKYSVEIHDPNRGYLKLSKKELSDYFTGVALELQPTAVFDKVVMRSRVTFSSLWGKLIGFKRAIAHITILSLLMQLSIIVSPFYIQLVVDESITKFDLNFLLVLGIAFGFLAVFRVIATSMRAWTISYYGNQAAFQMISNIVQHLLYLPISFFEKRHVGDVLSRIASVNPLQTAMTQSLVAVFIDGIMAFITCIVIFIYSPTLGFVVTSSALLLVFFSFLFYPVIKKSQEDSMVSEARKESFQIECIRAISTIKLHCAQSIRLSSWRNLFIANINSNLHLNKMQITLSTINGVITGLQSVFVIYLSAKLVIEDGGNFTIGMLIAFLAYRQYFTDSFVSLTEKIAEFRLLSLHLDRLADITESDVEGRLNDFSALDSDVDGHPCIEFRDVYFRFSDDDPWILCGVNFSIHNNDSILLSGDSGCGKSTIIKLILGLYKPTKGHVFINGKPLNDLNVNNWRKSIGVVLQDDQLLTGTLADNISFFDSDLDMSKVYRAANFAQIHDTITAMPMNYFSFVGDMGSVLSAGQKQRVLIARAMYRDPDVLILDEGTVNIDRKKEFEIVKSISKLKMTKIIVSHGDTFADAINRTIHVVAGMTIEK